MLSASVFVVLTTLVLALADILLGWRLPQPVRPALPIVLAVALGLALVIGVSAYGAPQKAEADEGERD